MNFPDADPTARATVDCDLESKVSELRDAAGAGYAREWGLFCDYAAATEQPALPTTITALAGFLDALPGRPTTVARRVRAIAAPICRSGYLLERPDTGPAASPAAPAETVLDAGRLIAACPTRGWPDGLWVRRDAFLIVLIKTLGHSHRSPATCAASRSSRGLAPEARDRGGGARRARARGSTDVRRLRWGGAPVRGAR